MGRLLSVLCLVFLMSGCLEDVGFFFSYNIDDLQETIQDGGVIIIGVANEDSDSAELIAGQLPAGLAVEPDGTVQGIPEETGTFEFTVETFAADGSSTLQKYVVEITEDQTAP